MCGPNATLNRALDCPQKSGHNACSTDWVAIIFPGILVVGKVLAGCIGSAPYVQVATWVMSSMSYLNALDCKIFVTNIKGYLESMQLPCFNLCGKMIFVVLRYSSRSA